MTSSPLQPYDSQLQTGMVRVVESSVKCFRQDFVGLYKETGEDTRTRNILLRCSNKGHGDSLKVRVQQRCLGRP